MYVGPAISGILHLGLLALALAPSHPDPIAPIDSGPSVEVELMTLHEYNAALSKSPTPKPSAPGSPAQPPADLVMNTPPPPPRPSKPTPPAKGVTLTAPPVEPAPIPDTSSTQESAVQALSTPPVKPFVDERALQDKPVFKSDILPKDKVRVAGMPDEPEQPRGVFDAPEIETDPDEPPEQQRIEKEETLPSSTDVAEATSPRREVPPKTAPVPRPKPRGSLASETSDDEAEVAAAATSDDEQAELDSKLADELAKRAAEAERQAEEERIAAEDARLAEEDRLAEEKLAEEAEAKEKAEAEAKRMAELEEEKLKAEKELEALRAEQELAKAEEEAARLAAEEAERAAIEQAEEEKRKLEEARLAALEEEKRKLEEELKRQREQEALEQLAQQKLLEEQRAQQALAEQKRLQEEQAALAQKALAEQYRLEQEALAQLARQQQLQQLNAGSTLNQQTQQTMGVGAPAPNAPPVDPFASMLAGLDNQLGAQAGNSGFDGRAFSRNVAAQQNAPPLTQGEQQNFLNQLSNCWALGSIGANIPIVEMRASFTSDGRVSNVTVISAPPGAQLAVERAMNALRDQSCQPFVLPREKYASWQQFDIVFDPRRMSMR